MAFKRLKSWLPTASRLISILLLVLLVVFGVLILSNPNDSILSIDTWMRDTIWVAIGAGIVVLAVCLVFEKCNLDVGIIRPQVLIVLLALAVITLSAVDSSSETNQNVKNIAALAVGGMIALATRIIENDAKDKNQPDGEEDKETAKSSMEDDPVV